MIARVRALLGGSSTLSGRSKALGLFFVTSLGARATTITCQLLQVPIALAALGTEAFGLWMTLSSVTYVLNFADMGIGSGVQNKISEAFGVNEGSRARTLFNSAFAFLICVGAVLAMILVPAALLLDFRGAFGLTEPRVISESSAAVAMTLGLFCGNLPLGIAQRLAFGLQKGWAQNVSLACGSVLGLACLFFATKMHAPLPWIILAATGPTLLGNIGVILALMNSVGWLNLRGFRVDFQLVRGILGLGVLFSIQQVLATVLFALPAIVISHALGSAAVTPLNLTQRLFNLFAVIQNAFMLPLWPAYSDAKAKLEYGWMRRTLRRSVLATLGLSVAPMAVGAIFAPFIIQKWVGNSSDAVLPSPMLIWLLFGWNALIFLQQPFGYLLAGVSEVRRITIYSIVSAAVAVTLMFVLVHPWRQEGVVFALIAGYLPFTALGSVIEALRFLRAGRPLDPVATTREEPAPL